MTYAESLAWLYATQITGMKLGLETISRLLRALDFETDAKIVHVAGTNGKGSVCAMAAAMCDAHGYRTALYTSPHLVTFRERIRIGDRLIPEDAVAAGLSRLRDVTADWQPSPTFFEYTTALGLDWFRQECAQVIVLETGLGGRLDATNCLIPAVSVLTSIEFDHTAWLGDTLAAIAGEKAGIIKPSVPVVSAPQAPEALEVIERAAKAAGSSLQIVATPIGDDQTLGLAGSHQRLNAALALAALEAGGIALAEKSRRRGLANVQWPGRFQRVENGRIILDGAHNPAAARGLARTWHEEFGDHHQATVILGILRDKDSEAICRALAPLAARFVIVPVRNPRSLTPAELSGVLEHVAPEVARAIAVDAGSALASARAFPETILVAGSFFLVGEGLATLTGAALPEPSVQ